MQPAIARLIEATNALAAMTNTMTVEERQRFAAKHPALAEAINEVVASTAHLNTTRRPRVSRRVIKCEYCGEEFVRLGAPTQVTCSQTCAQKRRHALGRSLPSSGPRTKYVEVKCAQCHEAFSVTEAAARTRRYCSRSCSARAPRNA